MTANITVVLEKSKIKLRGLPYSKKSKRLFSYHVASHPTVRKSFFQNIDQHFTNPIQNSLLRKLSTKFIVKKTLWA